MSRGVLVIGTHRSGTSAVAGALHALGVHMGSRLLGASEANPRGHFEDIGFLTLNDRIVGDWRDPTPDPSPYDLGEYRTRVESREAARALWGIKDPRLCFTARYILPFMEDPVIVCTKRAPEESAASLARRDDMSIERAREITRAYLDARSGILTEFLDVPVFTVRFDELKREPKRTLRELAAFVAPIEAAASTIIRKG